MPGLENQSKWPTYSVAGLVHSLVPTTEQNMGLFVVLAAPRQWEFLSVTTDILGYINSLLWELACMLSGTLTSTYQMPTVPYS